MKYRKLDKDTKDYTFGQGDKGFLADRDATAQAIYTRLKLLYAEWWENLTDGLPLWQSILGASANPKNKDAIDITIENRIKDTFHVNSIQNMESSFDSETRKYSFSCTVNTDYGQIVIEDETI